MKNVTFVFAIVVLLLASCASKPKSPVPVSPAPVESISTTVPFDGLWELPNGQFQVFKENAFILMDSEGAMIDTGIFTFTGTQLSLNLERDFFVSFDYIYESGNLRVSGVGHEWAHGIWKKMNYADSSNNPLVGYWEYTSEKEIRILHVLPFGWGVWYTCDTKYNLISKSEIRFEDNNTSEFRSVINGEDFPISFPVKYKFDGADLIVDTDNRYIKK